MDVVGFPWGRVNFLHSSYEGALFWIPAGSSVDNKKDVLVVTEQSFTVSRPFLPLTHL